MELKKQGEECVWCSKKAAALGSVAIQAIYIYLRGCLGRL